MKKITPLLLVTLSTALVGCMATKSPEERLLMTKNALDQQIANNLRAKAEKGAFYASYNIPSDAEIEALYGEKLSATDLEALRALAEEATRRYENEIVWPQWIKSIKNKSLPLAESAYKAGQYDKAREILWRAAATGVKPVDAGVREFGTEYLNTIVNPEQWRKIEKEMCDTVLKFEKDGKYNEAIEWLQKVPYVREYSTVLDAKLKLVKDEMLKLSVAEADAQPIIDATTELLSKVENIYDYTDQVKKSASTIATDVELEAYNRAVENFRKTLVRYNCTEANAGKLANELTAAATKLFESLSSSTTSTTGNLELGTGAINKRIDARREAMIARLESLRDPAKREAKLFALFDAKDLESIKAFLKAEMEAVLIEVLSSTITLVPGKELLSPLDLAMIGEEFRYTVKTMVKTGNYAGARELIWATMFPKTETLRTEYLRPIAMNLMLTCVNATQWAAIEADIAQLTAPDKDLEAALATLKAYPRIKTYTQDIDTRLELAATTANVLGANLTDEALAQIKAATAEMKNLVDNTDKMTTVTMVGTPVNRKVLDALLQVYRATLIQNDCTAENADKLVAMFNNMVNVDFNEIAKDKTTEVLHLGCNALNARIDALVAEKCAELEKAIAEAKAAQAAFLAHVDDFCKRVYEATLAKDFDAARAMIRDEALTGNVKQDATMYAIRIGMLNSVVNPAQCEALYAEIKQQMNALVAAKDYEALKQYIVTYPYVKDDFAKIDETLEALKGAIVDIPTTDEAAATTVADLDARIKTLLDDRAGAYAYPLDMTAVEKAVGEVAAAIMEQYYVLNKEAFVAKTMADILAAVTKGPAMTTAEMNSTLAELLHTMLAPAEVEIAKAKYLARLAEIDAEVSADTQITLAEEAIRRQLGTVCCSLSYKVNALLGEYARVFRDLKRQKEITKDQATVMLLGAAYLDQDVVIDRALELGAEINATSDRDPLARTAIMLALEAQNATLAKQLVENGADLTMTDAEGNSVMHYAVRGGNIMAVKALAAGTSVATANKRGVTPLFIAAARNQTAMVEALLACVEDDVARTTYVNMADADGVTAFNLAVRVSSREVLDALAAAGATYSPADLTVAAEKDYLAIAQWLIENSIDVNAGDTMKVACPVTATARYLATEGGVSKHAPCPKCTPPALLTPQAPEAPAKTE